MIETLSSLGASVESISQGGVTPLMAAARFGHLEAVKALIRQGANCLAKSQDNWSVLHYAVHGPDVPDVQLIVKYLLNGGVDVNTRCDGDSTALHLAVKDRKTYAVEILLENNADIHAKEAGKDGDTCLDIAVADSYDKFVKRLVDAGALWKGDIPEDTPRRIKDILRARESDNDTLYGGDPDVATKWRRASWISTKSAKSTRKKDIFRRYSARE